MGAPRFTPRTFHGSFKYDENPRNSSLGGDGFLWVMVFGHILG